MSEPTRYSVLPYVHQSIDDLLNGRSDVKVLDVVGHGYAGQVYKCLLDSKMINDFKQVPDNRNRCVIREPYQRANSSEDCLSPEELSDDSESWEEYGKEHKTESMVKHKGLKGKGAFTTKATSKAVKTDSNNTIKATCRAWQRGSHYIISQTGSALRMERASVTSEDECFIEDEYQMFALKVIKKSKMASSEVAREVEHLRAGMCQNVIKYYASAECIDSYWILTEYCPHGDLYGQLKKLDNTFTKARLYLHDVLKGLEYLHDQLIAHRDIKMKNILIADNDAAKLSDFGFAKKYTSKYDLETGRGGTKDYWAPEMCIKKAMFNPFKADIYALGVTFTGVCMKRAIKKKYEDVDDIITEFSDQRQLDLFSGMLHPDSQIRFNFSNIRQNAWFHEIVSQVFILQDLQDLSKLKL